MKIPSILLLLLPLFLQAASGQPEKIYSITRILHPLSYYEDQAILWEAETKRNAKNEDAWLNYYQAARNVNILSRELKFDLKEIVEQTGNAVPNTYSSHYLIYRDGQNNPELFHHVEKANALRPHTEEVFPEFVTYNLIKGNDAKVKEYCQKWVASGAYSPGILTWNYNALISLEPNAIFLTHGDNDTYPLMLLQEAKGIREDVTVMNVFMAQRPEYRNRVLKKLGIEALTVEENTDANFSETLIRHIVAKAKQPVYLGVGASKELRETFEEQLFIVGLAFKYSEVKFDNMAVLKNNYENKFRIDYLKSDWNNDFSQSVLNQQNLNYLPALIKLYRHYKSGGQEKAAEEIRNICLRIGKNGDREENVQAYLKGESQEETGPLTSKILVKELEKSMKPVGGKLYAAETELTNASYEAFLQDLLANREFDKLQACKIHDTDWRSLLEPEFKDYPDELLFQHGKPDDPRVPVKNISHEAADIYCAWITKVYNESTYPKKKHEKVRFRLPTTEEWEMAASGSNGPAPYPWGGHYIRNTKGCYLANFNTSKEPPCEDCPQDMFKLTDGNKVYNLPKAKDGAFFMVIADAYFPNDFGLYNTVGNLAEMVDKEGLAKGGSWLEIPDLCNIKAAKNYQGPDPTVGFRVFMEVLEQ